MNKEREYNNIEDLIQDESFRNWVFRNEFNDYWEDFAIDSSNNARLVENAKTFLLSFDCIEEKISDDFIEDQLNKLKSKLNFDSQKKINKTFSFIIATFIMAFLSGGYFFSDYYTMQDVVYFENTQPEGLIEQINNSYSPKLITLSDGSSVLLQPKSKLSYSHEFDVIKREVFLEGEAFFEVSKNALKPFIVYSNDVITQVYGTSFRVIAFDEQKEVKVIVKTGKVKLRKSKIFDKNDLNEITLLPNQAGRFDRDEKIFGKITEITENERLGAELSKIDNLSFKFVDAPISHIFSTIQEIYNMRIEFPEDKLSECYVTTSLSDVPLPEKLKILCFSIGENTSYELVDNKIIINSEGCK